MKIPNTPFSTRLSGSAKETELRIRSIFQWKKKRPPAAFVLLVAVLVLLCFGLFGFRAAGQPEHQTLYDIHREFIDITWKSRVAEITYYNTDHGFYEYTDGDDGIADVEDFFKSVQLGSSVNPRKYIKEDDKGYHIFEVYAGGGGRLKIKFFVDDRVVLVGSWEENEWPSNFADDAKAYRLPDGVDQDGILALLYSAAEDNEETSPTPEPPGQELPTLTVSAEDLFSTMQQMGEKDEYPAQTYQIEVTGLSVPVTLTVERNQATAVEAHGQFLTLSVPVTLYGNREFDLFEADGAVIFGCSYYRIGDMYILSPEGCGEIHPGEEASYYLYRDDQGDLKYTLSHNEIATITQAGALTVVTRYGELLQAYGDASIVNGEVIFAKPGQQEFLDRVRLQQEFVKNKWSQHFNSVEEMLENNRAAKEGREPSQPEPTPGRNEDNQFVLNYVDAMFAQGDTQLWAFLFPGTGPIAAPVDELYAQVRDVFARYEWTPETGSAPEPSMTHDDFTMYLVDGWSRRIEHITNSNRVSLSFTTEQGTAYAAYSYNGEPGSLSDALLALWGGPEFRYALVVLPPQGQDDRTLMEIYERQFREMYLNSGAIDDYKLQELELISVGEVIGGSQSPFFLMSYSVKPADLSAPCWRNYAVGEDGWVNISVEVDLSLTGYANNETVWRCGFWQYPNDKE